MSDSPILHYDSEAPVLFEDYARWLDSSRDGWHSYQRLKETQAWLATALALAGAAAAMNVDVDVRLQSVGGAVAATVAVVVLFSVLLAYLNMQFRSRWLAADYSHAVRRARCTLLQTRSWNPTMCAPRLGARVWPKSVYGELEIVQRTVPFRRGRWKKTPEDVWKKSRFWLYRDDRFISEYSSYTACWVALSAVLWRIWGGLNWWLIIPPVMGAVFLSLVCTFDVDKRDRVGTKSDNRIDYS